MSDELSFLTATGPMARAMRTVDWAATKVGPPATWPQPLRTAIRLILNTGHPMYVWWGPDLLCFYNDAYSASIGPERHPGSLGQPAREVWAEIWDIIGPQIAHVVDGHGSTWSENALVPITRNGRREDVYWTYSCSPIDDETAPSGIGGVLVVCSETTTQVEAARRTETERERLAAMFESAPGFMTLLEGPDHRFVYANAAYRRLLSQRNLVGLRLAEAVPELPGQGFLELLDEVRRSGVAFTVKKARLELASHPGGPLEESFLDFIYQPITDADGRVTSIFVEGHDVTEAHLAEQTLRESEARFRMMTDAVPQIVWIADAVGQVEFFNKRWYDYTGAPPEDLDVAAVARRYIHPDDGPATVAAFEGARASNGSFAVEHRILSATGEWRWFLAEGRAQLDATGEVLRYYGGSVDIHDRKMAENALKDVNRTLESRFSARTSELRLLERIVETADAVVQAADLDYRVIAMNKAASDKFARIFGVPLRVGDDMLAALAQKPEEQATMRAVWTRALAGEDYTIVQTFGDPTLARSTYEVSFKALRDEGGRVVGAFQIATDVTDRLAAESRLAEAEAQLRQAQKMEALGQLTGGVAHDFNNLLTPIVGGLDILQRRGLGGPREQRLIEGALQSADRARTLVGRLLAFARRQPLATGAVDLAALVEGMRDLVTSTLTADIRLVTDVAPGLPAARGDANQLEMAILNLAVNARDAMPDGGVLTIVGRLVSTAAGNALDGGPDLPVGDYLRLSVTDTGQGMDAATLARAVEPFFSTKGVGHGTGLGLSMVHGLAAQLGGALVIESAPGEGTDVALWLPVTMAEAHEPAPDEPATQAGLALLVDDEELARASTAEMLEDLGYAVVQASSAAEALALVDAGMRPDLLVSDHTMPGMTGSDLALTLRARMPGIVVLIVSGYAEVQGLEASLPHLAKPFRRAQIAAKIGDLRRR